MDILTAWRLLNAGLAIVGLVLLALDIMRRRHARREGWERRRGSGEHYVFSGFYWEAMALLLTVVAYGSINGVVNGRSVSLVVLVLTTTAVVYQLIAVSISLRAGRRVGRRICNETRPLGSYE